METFRFRIDTADGTVWNWGKEADDGKFVFVNTVNEVKDVLSNEASMFKTKAKEFSDMAKKFNESLAV